MEPSSEDTTKNLEIFTDCLSAVLVEKISRTSTQERQKPRRRARKATTKDVEAPDDPSASTPEDDTADLAEFIAYIAEEVFTSLPEDLQTLDHWQWKDTPALQERFAGPFTTDQLRDDILRSLPPSVPDSLAAYGITTPDSAHDEYSLLAPALSSYVSAVSAPPPTPSELKAQATECEICGRDWINLSYHHLIPRFVHDKVVKRGWHRPEELNNVAWICGACHRFVHRFADHETLARKYYTVELLMAEEDVRKWADWVGRLRWKKR